MDFGIASLDGRADTDRHRRGGRDARLHGARSRPRAIDVGEPADVYSLALTPVRVLGGRQPGRRAKPRRRPRARSASRFRRLRELPPRPSRRISPTCVDACLDPEPGAAPVASSSFDSDLERPDPGAGRRAARCPVRADAESTTARARRRCCGSPSSLALCAWGVGAVTAIAVAAGRPGLALVLGVLSAPAILVASRLPWAAIPLSRRCSAPLSAGRRPTRPSRSCAGRPIERARARRPRLVLACWWRPAPWVSDRAWAWSTTAPHGWTRSTSAGGQWRPGAAARPAGAARRRGVRRSPRPSWAWCCAPATSPLALLGALLWAAGLEAALASWSRTAALAGTPAAGGGRRPSRS